MENLAPILTADNAPDCCTVYAETHPEHCLGDAALGVKASNLSDLDGREFCPRMRLVGNPPSPALRNLIVAIGLLRADSQMGSINTGWGITRMHHLDSYRKGAVDQFKGDSVGTANPAINLDEAIAAGIQRPHPRPTFIRWTDTRLRSHALGERSSITNGVRVSIPSHVGSISQTWEWGKA